ncbi:carboxypeptidase G2 precursor [Variibacter gotjawalensis]|uniref:Carboxypeptidase G2 n=1 Tax=Variibacter gotjawalensis TaxID=1333996 RepID=A0A0S3PPC1_9BRAD|nr:M20 family metallopeptidase [Variibacter gotjawalensis]NIK48067.1 glutamate carboxypeptidase [Variibacter gotjawalensis]RZS49943.1 glutamate carboxypeptidase [Variibacter gotjawalensis]BAT57770.1 carboxypeptidase G2 precursor [Variibacter gotjawalensis]
MNVHFKPIDVAKVAEGIESWVKIESPTSSREAVNQMIDQAQSEFDGVPVALERIPGRDGYGDCLFARTEGEGKRILVLSHLDTVHPIGTAAGPLPIRREGDKMFGPGIYDMKGGAYLAMDAFRRVVSAGSHKLPITFLFTPDEEVGSPSSRAIIEAEAQNAAFAIVTEPTWHNYVVTGRKGIGRFDINATGVPAHAGANHEKGRSAINEIAHQILAIAAMTDYARGITTNVGMISGGTASNVIPRDAHISIDVRVLNPESAEEVKEKLLSLKPHDPDVKLDITGKFTRPPYVKSEGTEAFLQHTRKLAAEIGFELPEAPQDGGGSDANFTAALGVPTLDSLGIDGDGAHTHFEHGLLSCLEPRLRLFQRLMETLQ